MCHFLKPLKLTQELSQKNELQQWALVWQLLLWCLLRNCKKRQKNRRYRRNPPSVAEYFFAISRWIKHFGIIWGHLIFFSTKLLHHVCIWYFIFQISYYSTKKNNKCSVKMLRNFFWKKISWAQIIQKCIINREMA